MGPKPCTPEPLVVREAPPPIPDLTNRKVITYLIFNHKLIKS